MRTSTIFLLTFLGCSLHGTYAFGDMHSCKDRNGNVFFADETWKLPANCVERSTMSTDDTPEADRDRNTPSVPKSEPQKRSSISSNVSQQKGHDASEDAPLRQKLLSLLAEKKYVYLNDKIGEIQRSYEINYNDEKRMTELLHVFETVDPKVEAMLNAWAANSPNDYQPFLCRAAYLMTRGKYARGFAFSSATSDKKFQDMHYYYGKASTDCRKAVQLHPALVHAYAYLIDMGDSVDELNQKTLLDLALKNNPYTLVARQAYLANIAPRWGGSIEEMKAFVDEARPYMDRYPALKLLEGQIYIAEGLDADGEKQYPRAIDLYTKALTFGESSVAYWRRGNAHQHMSLPKTIADYDKAIALDSSFILAYYNRSAARIKFGDIPGATADLCRITELGMTPADIAREFQAPEADIKRLLAKGCTSK